MSIRIRNDLDALDVDLLAQILDWAVADEAKREARFPGWGSWEQHSWVREVRNGVCQTSFCIAGQTVVQNGYIPVLEDCGIEAGGHKVRYAEMCAPAVHSGLIDTKTNEPILVPNDDPDTYYSIESLASDQLGLSHYRDEHILFDGDNDLYGLVSAAVYFAARRGQTLALDEATKAYDLGLDDAAWDSLMGVDYVLTESSVRYAIQRVRGAVA